MLPFILSFSLVFSLEPSQECVVSHLQWASTVEIEKPFKISEKSRKAPKGYLERLYKSVLEEHGEYDPRFFALAWMESRLHYSHKRGDRGKACGPYQIHARHSYPMFHRKGGYKNWDEKKGFVKIAQECSKLFQVSYAVETLSRYLKLYDERDLPSCHHNSGIYGKCNSWYDKRVSYWETYFSLVQFVCDERVNKWL